MSAKRTSWNEFSSSMASAVICLSTVNVDDVRAAGVAVEGVANVNADVVLPVVDEPSIPLPLPTTQPPPPSQDVPSTSQVKPTPPPSLIAQPPSPQQQPQPSQDAEISMDLLHNLVKKLVRRNKLKVSKLRRLKKVGTAQRVVTSDDTVMDDVSKQGRIIADMDADVDVTLKDVADIAKVLSMQDDEVKPSELQEVVEVVTTAKLITEKEEGVVIRDPEETATPSTIIHTEAKSKDKGRGILVENPKPLKKQAQIEQDEAFARELEAELNKTINWDDVIDQVQRKEKEDNAVMRYQALKKKPQTKAQARKNMMIYLRNMAGFKMDYLKEMKYDDIGLIFEKYFYSNVSFLEKTKEQMEEEDIRALKRISKVKKIKQLKSRSWMKRLQSSRDIFK
nr:hypothetical protein [Tanacetum cinerariifolium]